MAIFGYGRVSTSQQDTEKQRLDLGLAGLQFDYWFADVVSGKVPAMQRKAFSEMLNKIRDGETLVVAKLDRLGLDAIDVLQTVRKLADRNIKVIVHQLGTTELSSMDTAKWRRPNTSGNWRIVSAVRWDKLRK